MKISSILKISSMLLATGGLLGAAVETASANDAKTFAGAQCHAQSDSFYTDVIYTFDGLLNAAANNDAGGDAVVTCPVTRDNTTNTNGLADLELYYKNTSTIGHTLDCTAYAMSYSGSIVKSVTRSASVGTGILDWNSSLNSSGAYGSYTIWCVMPPGSIRGYYSEEY